MLMNKNDIPIEFKVNKHGNLVYRFCTEWLPFWDFRKYTFIGWRHIWVFSADPLSIRDADAPEHWSTLGPSDYVMQCKTYGELCNLVETENAKEEERFLYHKVS